MVKVIAINKIKIGRQPHTDSPIKDVQYVLGANVSENAKTYDGVTYTHKLSSSGDNQITTCTIKFNCTKRTNIRILLLSSSESNYDFMGAGPLDNNTTTLDTYWCRSNHTRSCSGANGTRTIDYIDVGIGDHFIRVVYAKDVVGSNYSDCGWFKFEYEGKEELKNYVTPKSIILNNKDIMNIKINDVDYWKLEEYTSKFCIFLSGPGIGNTQYTFKYDNSHVFNSTKIDNDNVVINYDADALTIDKDHRFSKSITPTSWNNSNVTFKLVNAAPINDRTHPGVEIFKELNVKKLDLTGLDLTDSPNFNSFNNIFINLGTVNVVTGPKFDTRYVNTFEGAFAIPRGKPVLDFSRSPNFKINSSANRANIFYANNLYGNHFKFILNKNIDDFTKSVFNSTDTIEVSYV